MRGRGRGRIAHLRAETGQALVITVVFITVLFGFAAFAIDVGHAYFVQRELQRSMDAAALAGAQGLPNESSVRALAAEYGPGAGGKNPLRGGAATTLTVTTRCLASAPGCAPVNAVQVAAEATVSTWFGRVIGIDDVTVRAKATACSPCSTKPIDIMIVLDRTGSMCQFSDGRSDPACTDLNNAREGLRTFLRFFDPSQTRIGMAVFPPAERPGTECRRPESTYYHAPNAQYVLAPMAQDFRNPDGTLNSSSRLVSMIACMQGNGLTSYAFAIEEAQAELDRNGRPNAPDVIVFFSDGAANHGPNAHRGTPVPPSSPYRLRPCRQGVDSAAVVKARGTFVYSIGYDLNALGGDANRCQRSTFYPNDNRTQPDDESPAITAYQALELIATDRDAFYDRPNAGQLNGIFTRIASDILSPSSRLIDDDTP